MKKNVGGLIKVYYAFGYWWSREVLSGSVQTFKAASAVFSIKF